MMGISASYASQAVDMAVSMWTLAFAKAAFYPLSSSLLPPMFFFAGSLGFFRRPPNVLMQMTSLRLLIPSQLMLAPSCAFFVNMVQSLAYTLITAKLWLFHLVNTRWMLSEKPWLRLTLLGSPSILMTRPPTWAS